MEVLNAVRGTLVDCPSFINCPKVLFAARFIQPVAVAFATMAILLSVGEDVLKQKKVRFCDRCAIAGALPCVLSTIASTIVLFFPVPLWIKAVLAILSAASWELYTTCFYPNGLLYWTENFGEVRAKAVWQNVAWPIVGAVSSAVIALGGIIPINPIFLCLAAIGLVIEAAIKYGYEYCYAREYINTCKLSIAGEPRIQTTVKEELNLAKENVLKPIAYVLCEAALAFLYINPFIGISIPWFVNLLLCLLPAIQIAHFVYPIIA